ncbi:MAG: hypothetical protein JRF29_04950 [Deltaproteobacteria bacterium]|jgi:hypothetical protein|nr:hypothetical protein [Deltaproteobacteria bacterium]
MDILLLDRVRAGCKIVAEHAAHIRINHDRIAAYAATLPITDVARPEHDPACHYLGHGDDTAAFFLTLDAINFGSSYFPHLRKPSGRSGYFTIAGCLNAHFQKNGPFSARDLRRLTAADCSRIFAQDPKNKPIADLMQFFAKALNELGAYLQTHFNGSFTALIAAAGASAERLVQLLVKMPYFKDVALYDGRQVAFFKRAQLTAADLALAFDGHGLGRFVDLDQLTIFADNLVPHVLRVDNILIYPEKLYAQIEAGELIAAGSKQEIEIRASALHAVELIKAALNASGRRINAMALDFLLWNRGQQPEYKFIPRHRTRTVFY